MHNPVSANSDLFCSVLILPAKHLLPVHPSPDLNQSYYHHHVAIHLLPHLESSSWTKASPALQAKHAFGPDPQPSLLSPSPFPSSTLCPSEFETRSCRILGQLLRCNILGSQSLKFGVNETRGLSEVPLFHTLLPWSVRATPHPFPFSIWQTIHLLKPTQVSFLSSRMSESLLEGTPMAHHSQAWPGELMKFRDGLER